MFGQLQRLWCLGEGTTSGIVVGSKNSMSRIGAYKMEHAVKANVPQVNAVPKSRAILEQAVLQLSMPN